ncbi:tyrosine-type recombinase/integrase [Nakamurella sp.]|uniref:tyrosine-type recombinase/integrase n=1 Tax=Nakamurella sp. TaxID=1869182 RepID=UPI003B3AC002
MTPAIAKNCRGILRQALTYAVTNGASAPTTNGTFAILSQRVERGTKSPTAPTVPITKAQAAQIIADLKADEKTSKTDLPDILTFMAGTGCRTGEAIALTWTQLDLDSAEPTALINATVNGAGRRQLQTKTRAGVRRLALPSAVVTMLQARLAKARPESNLVFPSARGPKSDRAETPYWISNITGVIRTELDRLGHVGVTGRSFPQDGRHRTRQGRVHTAPDRRSARTLPAVSHDGCLPEPRGHGADPCPNYSVISCLPCT